MFVWISSIWVRGPCIVALLMIKFVRFFVHMMTSKSHSKIIWPLAKLEPRLLTVRFLPNLKFKFWTDSNADFCNNTMALILASFCQVENPTTTEEFKVIFHKSRGELFLFFYLYTLSTYSQFHKLIESIWKKKQTVNQSSCKKCKKYIN